MSTNPNKYNVVEAEGALKPRSCIDMYVMIVLFFADVQLFLLARFFASCSVIRHVAVEKSLVGSSDRFRLQIQEYGYQEVD